MKARKYRVSGLVQGVCFRARTRDEARRLGVAGWVRNLDDESVEVFAQGPEEDLARLEEFLREGPPAARVESVEQEDAEPRPLEGFRIDR